MSDDPSTSKPSPLLFRCARCSHPFEKELLSLAGLCEVCEARTPKPKVGGPDASVAPPGVARCKHCYYVIEGLPPQAPCPECGNLYDLSDHRTFTTRPPFVRWRLWLPGWLTALTAATIAMLVCVYGFNNFGAAVWVAVPLAGGIILGYRVRAGKFVIVLLCIALFGSLFVGLASFNLAGVFCGLILSAIFLAPIVLGTLIGMGTRSFMKWRGFSQSSYLPVLLAMLMPMVWAWLEGPARNQAVESVATEMVMDAPPERVWESLMFYEEVRHEPPWILKVGLARPLSTTGSSRSVGDIKRCLYNKGPITKRITQVIPNRRLAFEVIEQEIGYERDVRLVGGSFDLEPMDGGRTRLRLTTSYEPRLTPRFEWRWSEQLAVHTLHEYVMEGMRLKVLEEDGGG